MARKISADLFGASAAAGMSPQDKTTAAAREITGTEARLRNEKSAALKAARLARDAVVEPEPAPAAGKRRKATT